MTMEKAKIKQLRLSLGMTQEQFAAALGCTTSTVVRWESGKSSPSPLAQQSMTKLAPVLA
ncbi:MAG: helix-turn-helix transcriptional regulator [Cyanobacteriota bacterium]|nr:helix-turn-helix transcriptional regulator [Cyanobacteriota bacterium]